MCVSVWLCLPTYYAMDYFEGVKMATERTPDDGTCYVLKHVGDLLMLDERILCMKSWLCKFIFI